MPPWDGAAKLLKIVIFPCLGGLSGMVRFSFAVVRRLLQCIGLLILGAASGPMASGDSLYELPANAVSEHSLDEFVIGNLQFILMHELAHLIVGEKAVPILGPEESAADYIAATFLIRGDGQDDALKARLRKHVESAANAFAILWEHEQNVGTQVPYWGGHAVGIQRYYRLLCLLAGSRSNAADVSPGLPELPDDRAADCDVEYQKADQSVQWLLDNYGRRPGDPAGEDVQIVYEDTRTQMQERLMEQVRDRRLVELTVEALTSRFVLDRSLHIVLRVCYRPAAIWNPEEGELTLCYDLLDAFRQIYKIGLRAK